MMEDNSKFLNEKLFNIWMNLELSRDTSKTNHGNLQEILDDICERVNPIVLLQYLPQLIIEQLLKNKATNVKALLNVAALRNVAININANIENSSQPISLFSRASKEIRILLLDYEKNNQQKSYFWEFDGHYIGSVESYR